MTPKEKLRRADEELFEKGEYEEVPLSRRIAWIREEFRVTKDGTNPHFKNRYATLPNVLEALNPLLDKWLVGIDQGPGVVESIPCVVTSLTCLDDPYAEAITWSWPIVTGSDAHKTAGSSTYGRRYSILCGLAIEAEDDDGNTGSGREIKTGAKSSVQAALDRLK